MPDNAAPRPPLDDLLAALEAMPKFGPLLGAIVTVAWWSHGCTVEVTVDTLDEAGWKMLDSLIGGEGVEVVKRHPRQKVLIVSRSMLDAIPTTLAPNPAALFGPKVYDLTEPPAPSLISDWSTSFDY